MNDAAEFVHDWLGCLHPSIVRLQDERINGATFCHVNPLAHINSDDSFLRRHPHHIAQIWRRKAYFCPVHSHALLVETKKEFAWDPNGYRHSVQRGWLK